MELAAIEPVYETHAANDRPALYDGSASIAWRDRRATGHCLVTLGWAPHPMIRVRFRHPLDRRELEAEPRPFALRLDEINLTVPVTVGRVSDSIIAGDEWERTVEGIVLNDLVVGNPAPTEEVIIHIPNFPGYVGAYVRGGGSLWTGRLVSETQAWRIDLDLVHHSSELFRGLSETGGFAITHVGRITRLDGRPIEYEQVDGICETLRWWLSFVRGEATGPALVVGRHAGRRVWERWTAPAVTAWRDRLSWLPYSVSDAVDPPQTSTGGTLGAIADVLSVPARSERLRRAVSWYNESVSSNKADTTIVLAQAGLELMAWLRLVDSGVIREEGFGRLTASDSLRLTLALVGIPSDIDPSASAALHAAAQPTEKGGQQLDGPGAITEIRNSVVHPKARRRFDENAVSEGGDLAIRYLELLLLRWLGFDGMVLNRLCWGRSEYVPWSLSSGGPTVNRSRLLMELERDHGSDEDGDIAKD